MPHSFDAFDEIPSWDDSAPEIASEGNRRVDSPESVDYLSVAELTQPKGRAVDGGRSVGATDRSFVPSLPLPLPEALPEESRADVVELTYQLDEVRAELLGNPETHPVDRAAVTVEGSQADFATLIVGSVVLRDEAEVDSSEGLQPELLPPEQQLSMVRSEMDAGIVRDIVLSEAQNGPRSGSTWEILATVRPELVASNDGPKTEKEFFEGLALRNTKAEPEVDMAMQLAEGMHAVKDEQARQKGLVSRIVDRVAFPRESQTDRGREKIEELRIRNLRLSVGHQLAAGDIESGLRSIRRFIEGQNDYANYLLENNHPDESWRGELPPIELPGLRERYANYIMFAYRTRMQAFRSRHEGERAADFGLEVDIEQLVTFEQQLRHQAEFAGGQLEFMRGVRKPPTSEERRDVAALEMIRLNNRLRHGSRETTADSGQINDTESFVDNLIEGFMGMYKTTEALERGYFSDGSSTFAKGLRPMTPQEFSELVQRTAALYNIVAGYDLFKAEQIVDKLSEEVLTRLHSEAMANGRQSRGYVIDVNRFTTEELRSQLTTALNMATQETAERGRPKFTTQRLIDQLTPALRARSDPSGAAMMDHLSRADEDSRAFLTDQKPGDVLVYSGGVLRSDGPVGALAVVLAAAGGAREISIMGGGPLASGSIRQIGRTAIRPRGSVTPHKSESFRAVLAEGRVGSSIGPSFWLDHMQPNGIGAVSATLNPKLAAELVMAVDPQGFSHNEAMRALLESLPTTDREDLDFRRQFLLRNRDASSVGNYSWALIHSTVCRFTNGPDGELKIEYGHATPTETPDLTLVLFKHREDGRPNDHYIEVVEEKRLALVR